MTLPSATAPAAPPGRRPPHRSRWPDRVGYLAAAWAAVYGVAALLWTVTGDGFPFGPGDPGGDLSLLRGLPAEVGAPLFAGVLLATAAAALAMAGPHALQLHGLPRRLLLTFGWAVAAALLLVVAAARWGRRATWLAAAIPVLYAVTRLAWLAGIPLGISETFLRELQDSGAVWAGGGLGAFAVAGGILTLGLTQRWGEVFPRWMPGVAGQPVPVMLAVVPASLVAVFVTSASLGLLTSGEFLDLGVGGLAVLPMLLWPLWGVALGAATLAYHLRRRGRCARCGRV